MEELSVHRAPVAPNPLKIPNELVKHTAVHSSLPLWCASKSCCIDCQGNFELIAEQKPSVQCSFLPQPLRCIPVPQGQVSKFALCSLASPFLKFSETNAPNRDCPCRTYHFIALLSDLVRVPIESLTLASQVAVTDLRLAFGLFGRAICCGNGDCDRSILPASARNSQKKEDSVETLPTGLLGQNGRRAVRRSWVPDQLHQIKSNTDKLAASIDCTVPCATVPAAVTTSG